MTKTESLMGEGRLSPDPQKNSGITVKYQFQLETDNAARHWQGFIRLPSGTKLPTSGGGLFKSKKTELTLTIDDGRTFKVSPEKIIATLAGQDTYPINGSDT